MSIELGMLDKLKIRVQLARKIDSAQHKVKKENHERNWMKETAEAMDIELDSDVMGQVNLILIYLLLFTQHRTAIPIPKTTDRRSRRRKFKMQRPPTSRRSSRISYHSLSFLKGSLRDISLQEVVLLPMILSLVNVRFRCLLRDFR